MEKTFEKRRCRYCGEWFVPFGNAEAGRYYCSSECRTDYQKGQARLRLAEKRERRIADEGMKHIEKGVLDERLKECRERGISYAELQKERTLNKQRGDQNEI